MTYKQINKNVYDLNSIYNELKYIIRGPTLVPNIKEYHELF